VLSLRIGNTRNQNSISSYDKDGRFGWCRDTSTHQSSVCCYLVAPVLVDGMVAVEQAEGEKQRLHTYKLSDSLSGRAT
jgi:hypothetical protein